MTCPVPGEKMNAPEEKVKKEKLKKKKGEEGKAKKEKVKKKKVKKKKEKEGKVKKIFPNRTRILIPSDDDESDNADEILSLYSLKVRAIADSGDSRSGGTTRGSSSSSASNSSSRSIGAECRKGIRFDSEDLDLKKSGQVYVQK
jgi:outer membrane biosynthesis protein TonB